MAEVIAPSSFIFAPKVVSVECAEVLSVAAPPATGVMTYDQVIDSHEVPRKSFAGNWNDEAQTQISTPYNMDAFRLFGSRVAQGARNWVEIGKGESYLKRAGMMGATAWRGSLKWQNLLFGEAMALVPQGILQEAGAPTILSLGAFLATTVGIEYGYSKPIANNNEAHHPHLDEPVDKKMERNFTAAGEAFWLGGAWGVESGRLNNKEKWGAIAAYMGWAAMLGVAAEHNNLASTIISSSLFFGGLLTLAAVRTFNAVIGHEGFIDRMATRTSRAITWAFEKHRQVKNRPRTAEEKAVQVRLERAFTADIARFGA